MAKGKPNAFTMFDAIKDLNPTKPVNANDTKKMETKQVDQDQPPATSSVPIKTEVTGKKAAKNKENIEVDTKVTDASREDDDSHNEIKKTEINKAEESTIEVMPQKSSKEEVEDNNSRKATVVRQGRPTLYGSKMTYMKFQLPKDMFDKMEFPAKFHGGKNGYLRYLVEKDLQENHEKYEELERLMHRG